MNLVKENISIFFDAIRFKEVFLLTGFPIMGFLLSGSWELANVIYHAFAFFLLFLSIYQLNAYFGYVQDFKNERLKGLSKFSKNFYLKVSLICLGASLILLSIDGAFIILLGVGIYLLWALYSQPVFGTKNYPLLGNLTHFIMGIIHFFLGFLINSSSFLDPMFLAIYFSLLFTGGHLIHELIDCHADKKNKLKTSATFFGQKKTILMSQILFICSFLDLIFLYTNDYLPLTFFIPFSFAFIIQVSFFIILKVYKESENGFLRYRQLYRYLYLLAGGLWIVFNY
ncbi:MAG: hypothetical protein DRQ88_04370 [Epsilonproteobacteria bacterium]|nr:MAG: hypothetical protein DRQ89_10070 [Campylobacterota bacterium]RLA66993.1 MAG: hypothetical protein DRQ88_04370 [Campylobacterota bacterium]